MLMLVTGPIADAASTGAMEVAGADMSHWSLVVLRGALDTSNWSPTALRGVLDMSHWSLIALIGALDMYHWSLVVLRGALYTSNCTRPTGPLWS